MFDDFLPDYPRRRIPAFLPFGIKASYVCVHLPKDTCATAAIGSRIAYMQCMQFMHTVRGTGIPVAKHASVAQLDRWLGTSPSCSGNFEEY